MSTDKKPLQSKKFIAFLISIFLIAAILITTLLTQTFNWAMKAFMCIGIFSISFICVGYIFKQAGIDKFNQGILHLGEKLSGLIPKRPLE
jgi:hypothetical protein